MALAIYNFHRILIVAATGFFALLSAYGLTRFNRQASAESLTFAAGLKALNGNLIMGLAATLAAVVGAAYFVYFNRKLARQSRDAGE